MLQQDGPLLIACNHPNSFLDAIILATLFKKPVYSLARGDAFAGKFYTRLLYAMKMFPVYRASEGVENLENNYGTFEKCKELFKKGGIVLIFSEGRCINEWKLRPLMKGTARLAISSWQEGIPLKVLPTGINYNSFHSFGKNLQLNFGNIIFKEDIQMVESHGKMIAAFNAKLKTELDALVVQVDKNDKDNLKKIFEVKQPVLKKIALAIPAVIGAIIHAPLFFPLKRFVWSKAAHNDHYDSLMVGILFLAYPLYLLIISLTLVFIFHQPIFLLLLLVLPFAAWCTVQLKNQF